MKIYHLYTGTKSNGDPECMAINPDELEAEFDGDRFGPEDFFKPDTTDVKKAGEIAISGDTYLLDDCFSVRS